MFDDFVLKKPVSDKVVSALGLLSAKEHSSSEHERRLIVATFLAGAAELGSHSGLLEECREAHKKSVEVVRDSEKTGGANYDREKAEIYELIGDLSNHRDAKAGFEITFERLALTRGFVKYGDTEATPIQ